MINNNDNKLVFFLQVGRMADEEVLKLAKFTIDVAALEEFQIS